MAGRVPELYATALGTLKAGWCSRRCSPPSGRNPIRTRMEIGSANVLVTTAAIYKRKIASWRDEIPTLKLMLIVGDDAPEGCVALGPAMDGASPERSRPSPTTRRTLR
jgi:acetyl-CoA synthetase